MKNFKIVNALLALFVVMPIWFYLLYQILSAVNASELSWFLYWIYLPVGLICSTISKLLDNE